MAKRGVFILPRRSKGEPIPDEKLFPGVWEEVRLLRRRNYLVTKLKDGRFKVGNSICTVKELIQKAQREQRLSQAFPVISSVGVPL